MLNLKVLTACSLLLFGVLLCFMETHLYQNRMNAVLKSKIKVYNVELYGEFNSYLKKFNKSYVGDEYFTRLHNYRESLKEIEALNALENGAAVFGETKFADMSKEEFARMIKFRDSQQCNTRKQLNCTTSNRRSYQACGSNVIVKCDWRDKGFVTPVLDQKLCSGCWAFSIVGVMETMAAKNNLGLDRRSVQQLIDCSSTLHCKGGNVGEALNELCLSQKGITTEDKYPLTLYDETCSPRPKIMQDRRIYSYVVECEMDENTMVDMIGNNGPLIAIVNGAPLQYYISGIIYRACHRSKDGGGGTDHAVQLIGYDLTGSIPYYIVRNSMGVDFGIEGYLKIAKGVNVCGVSDEVARLEVVTI